MHILNEHFRLGFEDFPISYPVIFEEFLMCQELFEEYFSKEAIDLCCKSIIEHDAPALKGAMFDTCLRISQEKALAINFVLARVTDFLTPLIAEKDKNGR
ncbi:hypothetical protein FACS1894200_12420 [Spirochaetia bacterium]|nr:hypothetical protein FACS1894200_12420 [Spirochaetia bacterium]